MPHPVSLRVKECKAWVSGNLRGSDPGQVALNCKSEVGLHGERFLFLLLFRDPKLFCMRLLADRQSARCATTPIASQRSNQAYCRKSSPFRRARFHSSFTRRLNDNLREGIRVFISMFLALGRNWRFYSTPSSGQVSAIVYSSRVKRNTQLLERALRRVQHPYLCWGYGTCCCWHMLCTKSL